MNRGGDRSYPLPNAYPITGREELSYVYLSAPPVLPAMVAK